MARPDMVPYDGPIIGLPVSDLPWMIGYASLPCGTGLNIRPGRPGGVLAA